jgi:transcription-repair coupling factor (superfamily II helicase)
LNEVEDRQGIESFAAEMIDRFGPLPEATKNLVSAMEAKLNCKIAGIAKLDVGPKGALVHFWQDRFEDLPGLLAYVERLKGTAKLRPDSKLVIQRNWPTAEGRMNGVVQLSRGLAQIIQKKK